mmetsp:Transcript_72533/g.143828  ORF Transcript_72533/g.143828 Transcript_72533/m.143828 type:complete len:103 (-) Transcript_72533:1257-1565(-)
MDAACGRRSKTWTAVGRPWYTPTTAKFCWVTSRTLVGAPVQNGNRRMLNAKAVAANAQTKLMACQTGYVQSRTLRHAYRERTAAADSFQAVTVAEPRLLKQC